MDLNLIHNGTLPGEVYQNLRSELGQQIDVADGPTQQTLIGMQEALDDAVSRGIQDPALMQQWQQARTQYRNFRVIERAITLADGTEIQLADLPPALTDRYAIVQPATAGGDSAGRESVRATWCTG